MFKLSELADKIRPEVTIKQKRRTAATNQVVEESKRAREYSDRAVEESYRIADQIYSQGK